MILGARKIIICIIVVNRVPECVVHKLADFRGGYKVNSKRRKVYMGRLILKVRYTNPYKKDIHTHISGSIGLVKYGVYDLIIYLD